MERNLIGIFLETKVARTVYSEVVNLVDLHNFLEKGNVTCDEKQEGKESPRHCDEGRNVTDQLISAAHTEGHGGYMR